MNARLTNNLGLKILSILLAFFVWLLVVNVSNPEVTRSQDVALEIMNDSVLLDANRTYELSRKNVSVTYEIHTLDEYKIRPSDFRAYIDLSELYDVTGSVQVKVEVLNNSNLLRSVYAKPGVVRVQTEEIQSKDFHLTTHINGRVMDGYTINEIRLAPDSLTVEGPMSQVGLINSVGIDINIENASADMTGVAQPVFYDANGNELTLDDRVLMNIDEVDYHVSVNRVKEIPLELEVSGTAAAGYRYTGYQCTTERIAVSGRESVLDDANVFTIPESALNVDNLSSNQAVSVDLRNYLPDGLSLAEWQSPVIEVVLEVEPLTSKKVNLTQTDILFEGAEDDRNYRITPNRLEVTVHGLDEALERLRNVELGASIDVTGLENGTYEAVISFSPEDGYTIDDTYVVQLIVMDRSAGPGEHLKDPSMRDPGNDESTAEAGENESIPEVIESHDNTEMTVDSTEAETSQDSKDIR
jgi:YbbR domain-containing protein